jgi:hypothetical protein
MPFNDNGVYYQSPVLLSGAQITPRIISADVSLPTTPFSFEDCTNLFAQLNIHEMLITALTGANNDLAFIARATGTTPTVRVALVDPSANNAALSVSVTGEDITVNLATGAGGAITTTAAQIKTAIEAHAAANALVVVALAPSNDGTGVVTALAQTALGAVVGTTPTLDVTLKHGIDANTLATHSAFAQKTAVGSEFKSFSAVGAVGQWVFDIGADADERFAVSIVAQYRP